MSIVILGADLALLISSALAALWAYRARDRVTRAAPILTIWSLGSVFIALAVLLQLLPATPASNLGTLRRMSLNLAIFAALPLMAAALLALGRGWEWSTAAWGRGLLGLFALFELTRQLGYGARYTEVLGLASLAAVAIGSVLLTPVRARYWGLAGAAALAAALLLGTTNPLLTHTDPVSLRAFGALALLLLSSALHHQLKQKPAVQ